MRSRSRHSATPLAGLGAEMADQAAPRHADLSRPALKIPIQRRIARQGLGQFAQRRMGRPGQAGRIRLGPGQLVRQHGDQPPGRVRTGLLRPVAQALEHALQQRRSPPHAQVRRQGRQAGRHQLQAPAAQLAMVMRAMRHARRNPADAAAGQQDAPAIRLQLQRAIAGPRQLSFGVDVARGMVAYAAPQRRHRQSRQNGTLHISPL